MTESHLLLRALDALVSPRRGTASGMAGRIAVAVREGSTAQWWSVSLAPSVATAFHDERPEGLTAVVTLSGATALALLRSGQIADASEVDVEGDGALFARVIALFVTKQSPFAAQIRAIEDRKR